MEIALTDPDISNDILDTIQIGRPVSASVNGGDSRDGTSIAIGKLEGTVTISEWGNLSFTGTWDNSKQLFTVTIDLGNAAKFVISPNTQISPSGKIVIDPQGNTILKPRIDFMFSDSAEGQNFVQKLQAQIEGAFQNNQWGINASIKITI